MQFGADIAAPLTAEFTVDVLNGEHQVRICGRIVYGFNGRRF